MDDNAHQRSHGMQWIRGQFASMLGLTPDNLDWVEHSSGALLKVPIADEKHHVLFDHQQLESAADEEVRNEMLAWIAEHIKEARRAPSPRESAYKCTFKR